MSKYGEVLESGALRFVRDLPGPIERVWEWIVDPDKRALWLAGGRTEPGAGGVMELSFDNDSLTPHDDPTAAACESDAEADGHSTQISCDILIWEPPHRLSITWPNRHGGRDEIAFTLSEHGEHVRLELVHHGINDPIDLIGASAGWHGHFQIMADKLIGQIPAEAFWTAHKTLEDEYRSRLAKRLAQMR